MAVRKAVKGEKKSAFREDWIEKKILSSYLAMFNVIFI